MGRSGVAAALLLAAAPLAAQDNSAESTVPAASAPAPAENIGPRELQNFSLDGTVTRRSEPAATVPVTARPEARAESPLAAPVDRPAPVRSASADARQASARQLATDPLTTRPTLREPSAAAPATTAAAPAFSAPIGSPSAPIEAPGGFSPLPWLAALLLLAAGAAVYFGRQRVNQRYAVGGASEFAGGQEPRPAAPPLARAPAPRQTPAGQTLLGRPDARPAPAAPVPSGVVTSSLRSAPAAPPGIVNSSLRPWLEVELEPSQALVNDEHAAIAFDVTLFNSGSAPARDVAVEACLINAGQAQDEQLAQFYTAPGRPKDTIPAVAPMARITLKSAVRLQRSAVREYEVEGRKLFMPMVAINSRYRWSSGEGQSAASFLVGRVANDSDKLGPLSLDKGARGWKGLSARRYEKGIRR